MKRVFLIFALVTVNLSAQNNSYTAMVLQCTGTIKLIDLEQGSLIKPGSILKNGDSVWIADQASLQILDITGSKQIYRQSTRLNISGQTKNDPLAAKIIRQMAVIHEWSKTAAEKMTVRSGNAAEIFLESPRNSTLTEMPQHLSWIENSTKKFDVAIRCYDNDFTFDETITGNKYAISEKIGIKKNVTYHWYVKPHYETAPQIPVAVWFSVMNESEKQQWLSEKKHLETISDTTTAEYRLLYAQFLLQYEMNQQAKMILDEIVKAEPYNSTAQLLMAVACERLEMIPEAQHALKLSQK